MKRNLLKAGALVLSIMLCLCGTLSVFAAPGDATTKWDTFANVIGGKGQVTVNTKDVEGAEGTSLTATAYKLIDVSYDDDNLPAQPLYKWNAAVKAWLETNETYKNYLVWEGEGEDAVATDEVSDVYLNLISDIDGLPVTEAINAFAGAISKAITAGTISADALASVTETLTASGEEGSTDRTATFDTLTSGSYLVLINGGKLVYRPTMANLTPEWKEANAVEEGSAAGWYVESPQTLNIKASPVEITKTVNDPSAAIGDTVTFTIGATVPLYPADAVNTAFTIKDTMSKGLGYVANSVKVFGVKAGEADAELTADTHYTFAYANAEGADAATKSGSFTIQLGGDFYANSAMYDSIKVTYDATITKDAVVGVAGNPNDATLEYANDPYDTDSSTTKTTETKVYTYGLDLTKTNTPKDGEEAKPLSGAEFSIYKGNDATGTAMNFVKEDGEGNYRVASAEDMADAAIEKTSTVTTANGKLNLRGLDATTYTLKETKAPAGYVLLNGTVSFTITDDKDDDGNDGKNGIAEDDNAITDATKGTLGYVAETIQNREGFNLPLTGGMGTVLFTAGGIALIALAAVLLFVANRKKSSRD